LPGGGRVGGAGGAGVGFLRVALGGGRGGGGGGGLACQLKAYGVRHKAVGSWGPGSGGREREAGVPAASGLRQMSDVSFLLPAVR
jgi:hypothetical protein